MKKRIITLLAIVALLVTCAVFAVQADGTDTEVDVRSTFKCPCSACTAARAAAVAAGEEEYYLPLESWTQLPTSGTLSAGGHYWTNTDVETTGSLNPSGEVVILLDGAELKRGGTLGTNGRVFGPSGNSITHLVGNDGAKVLSRPDNSSNGLQGTVAQLYNASSSVKITFHVYGDVTFDNRSDVTTAAGYGGFFKLASAGAKLWVHDYGTAQGLKTDTDPTFNGLALTSSRLGDCLYLTAGKVILEACTLNDYAACANIYQTGGTLVIGAGVTFSSGAGSAYDIYKSKVATGYIQVDEDWMKDTNKTMGLRLGELTITTHGAPMNKANQMFGNWDPAGSNGEGSFTAISGKYSATWTGITLYYPDRGNPPLVAWGSASDGAGFLAPRAQLFKNDGSHEWIITIDGAIDEYNDLKDKTNAYIKLWSYTQNTTMSATETAVIDLNGHSLGVKDTSRKITIADGAKLYLFDSTKAAGAEGASIATTNVQPVTQFGGKTYVVIPGETTSTIYPVEVSAQLTGVTLRPAAAGMYFTAQATVNAADPAKAVLCTGVAVSVDEIGTTLENTAWTAVEGQTTANGILVQNILKEDLADTATAKARSEQPIYAEACVTYGGELLFLGNQGKSVDMTTLMGKLNDAVDTDQVDATELGYLAQFYKNWMDKFEGLWTGLEKIAEAAANIEA